MYSFAVVIVPNGCPDVGQNYSLTCRVHGLSNSTIQWSRVGSNRVIHRNATLEFFPLAIGDAEKYKCTSVFNLSLSATENVTVNSKSASYSCHRAIRLSHRVAICTYVVMQLDNYLSASSCRCVLCFICCKHNFGSYRVYV